MNEMNAYLFTVLLKGLHNKMYSMHSAVPIRWKAELENSDKNYNYNKCTSSWCIARVEKNREIISCFIKQMKGKELSTLCLTFLMRRFQGRYAINWTHSFTLDLMNKVADQMVPFFVSSTSLASHPNDTHINVIPFIPLKVLSSEMDRAKSGLIW